MTIMWRNGTVWRGSMPVRMIAVSLIVVFALIAPTYAGAEETLPAGQDNVISRQTGTQQEHLTLDRCIEIALRKNPSILAASNAVVSIQNRVGQARSNYYPQISGTGAYNRIEPVAGTAGSILGRQTPYDSYTGNVTLTQNILDFGKTSAQVDIQKFNLDASRSDLNTTTDQIIFSVKQAYFGVLQAIRNRDLATGVVKQAQEHLDQAKGFYEVGTKAKIDVTKAAVDLSNAKLSLIRTENVIKVTRVVLKNAMGVPDAPDYPLEDNLSYHKFEVTFTEALNRAYDNRPDLKSLTARRQAADATINLAKKGYYPVLNGTASYNWAGEDFPLEKGWTVGAAITFPLFSGFLTTYQVAEARSNLLSLKANEESLKQQILLDIQQAYLNLQEAEETIAAADLAVKQAQENLDLANGRYAAGVGSPIEVTDALTSYANAQFSYNAALYNYKIAKASIEKAMGER